MYSTMTPRFLILYVFLFVYFPLDVNAKSLVSKNDNLRQQKDKETSFSLDSNSRTTSLISERDSTFMGVPTNSSHTRTNANVDTFRRPSYVIQSNDVGSNSELKCKQGPKKRRRRRYVLQGSKLKNYDVTWTIKKFSDKLSRSDQIWAFKDAFKVWSSHCALTFRYVRSGSAAIEISFERGNHGDQVNFDQGGPIKAHAYFPQYGSAIHFDDDENWVRSTSGPSMLSLLSVAIHEIGHSLGLSHSNVPNAVMYSVLRNGKDTLHSDDIKGIQSLYGTCTVRDIDAVLTYSRRYHVAYVFKNAWVWEVSTRSGIVQPGYPKKITDHFRRMKDEDHPYRAVFYSAADKGTYFMNDGGYYYCVWCEFPTWQYPDWNTITWSFWFLAGLGAADAGFADRYDRNMFHFFKGSRYWKYNLWNEKVIISSSISQAFPGVPNDLDEAYYNHYNNRYYFIKGQDYYMKRWGSSYYYNAGRLTDLFSNICFT